MNTDIILKRLEEKLKEIEQELGVKAMIISSSGDVVTNISIEIKPSDNYNEELRLSKLIGFDKNIIGVKFEMHSTKFIVIDIEPKRKKYKIVTKNINKNNTTYFPVEHFRKHAEKEINMNHREHIFNKILDDKNK